MLPFMTQLIALGVHSAESRLLCPVDACPVGLFTGNSPLGLDKMAVRRPNISTQEQRRRGGRAAQHQTMKEDNHVTADQ